MKFHLPDDPKARGEIVKAQAQKEARQTEMGAVGMMFGGAAEKPGNIAGFAILIAFLGILVLIIAPESGTFPKREAITLFGSIITGALGYLFGRSANG